MDADKPKSNTSHRPTNFDGLVTSLRSRSTIRGYRGSIILGSRVFRARRVSRSARLSISAFMPNSAYASFGYQQSGRQPFPDGDAAGARRATRDALIRVL